MSESTQSAALTRMANDPAAFRAALMLPGARGTVRLADALADFQREWFASLDPAFLAVARFEQPPCGRFMIEGTKGSGKDFVLAIELLWLLAFARRPVFCQIGAADQDQADELRKSAKGILYVNKWLAQRIAIQSSTIICASTDSSVEIIPADVAGSHGARPDVCVINELHAITQEEFCANLLDNATKVPRGVVVIATNAGFKNTWQYTLREECRTSPRWTFHQYDRPAPWISESEIAERRRISTPARFNRLWRGVWCSDTGDAISSEDIDACIVLARAQREAQPDYHYLGGVDLGIKHDETAVTILGVSANKRRIELAHVDSWKAQPGQEVDLRKILSQIVRLHERFHIRKWLFDPWQATLLMQLLRGRSIPVEEMAFSSKNLDTMASVLVEVFKSHSIALYDDPPLLRDIRAFQMEERGKYWRLVVPRNERGHSDRGVSFTIALPAAFELLKCGVFEPPKMMASRSIVGPSSIGGGRHGILLNRPHLDRDHHGWQSHGAYGNNFSGLDH